MAHARKQIRDQVITALTGLTTTGNRVYASRSYPMDSGQLPGLVIYTNSQSSELVTIGTSPLLQHSLEVVIEAYVKDSGSVDDIIDTIIKEIEIAIKDDTILQNMVKWIYPNDIEVTFSGEGEQKIVVAPITFDATFQTREGLPETII